MKYLLDTNICVFYLRGKYDLNDQLESLGIENFYISEITIFELYFGAERSENPNKNYKKVDDFILGLQIIPIFDIKKIYAQEKLKLWKLGKPVHDEFDILIAATAIEKKLILITDNTKHFQNFENLQLENWIQR